MKRLRDQSGFSLAELLVADLVGGFVITAAITMLIVAFNSSNRVNDRVNATQVGRTAMESIRQRVRSQTCLFPLEYKVNGGTATTGAQASIVHADTEKLVFFGDIGSADLATPATGSVGFHPQLRYLYLVTDSTGRRGTLVDGWRKATNTSSPFNYSISPVASLESLASPGSMNSVPPTYRRAIADGIGNMVSESAPVGATSPTVPLFRYYDAADAQIGESSALGAVPTSELGSIVKIVVGFKVYGLTKKDQSGGSTNPADRRTATFRDEIYLRTIADRCQ